MSGLVEIVKSRSKYQCDWCAVALFLVAINYALDFAAHMGG